MTATSDNRSLKFHYPLATGLAVAVLGLLVAGLAWLNSRRAQGELDTLQGKLCAELPPELLQALAELPANAAPTENEAAVDTADDSATGKGTAAAGTGPVKRAFAVLEGFLDAGRDQHLELTLVQRTRDGWLQWQPWSRTPEWSYDSRLQQYLDGDACHASLDDGQLLVVRRVQQPGSAAVLVMVERERK